jgi:lysophospholipase L1-like esterase
MSACVLCLLFGSLPACGSNMGPTSPFDGGSSSGGSGPGGSSSSGASSSGSAGGSSGFSSGGSGGNGGASSGGSGGSSGSGSGGGGASASDSGTAADGSGTFDASAMTGDSGGNPGGSGNVGPATDVAARMLCTGTSPIVCHFGGNPGHYAVTVVLGNAAVAAQTEVLAETSRQMLGFASSAVGATQRYSFDVNVRQPEGQPAENVSPGTPGLDLYFYGSAGSPGEDAGVGGGVLPQLASIGYAAATNPVIVYLAGDSTVCDQTDTNYAGWGQLLPRFFDYPVSIANYADSGESSASFLGNAKLWGAIASQLMAGDWVFIQFGHNDKTTLPTAFHDNIATMVTQAKAKGALPVLVTPPARATFSGSTLTAQFVYTNNGLTLNVPDTMKQVAIEENVPLIDLTTITTTWYNQMGPSGWQQYHALGTDQTHTNRSGGLAIAGFVAADLRSQNIQLSAYLR